MDNNDWVRYMVNVSTTMPTPPHVEWLPALAIAESRPLPRSYRSIWRVLHVDGFEVRHRLTFIFGRNAFLLGNFDGEQIRS